MTSFAQAASKFKCHPFLDLSPDLIVSACQQAGHVWRERLLGPVLTFQVFMLQVLESNCSCRRALRKAHCVATTNDYCKARKRLPLRVFERLARDTLVGAKKQADSVDRWLGHLVLLIDGSGFSMPDTAELRNHFGVPGERNPGCSFPVAHTMFLMDWASGLLRDFVVGPNNQHDLRQASGLNDILEAGAVIVGDRAFGTYAYLATLQNKGIHAVCRLHQRTVVSFAEGRLAYRDLPKAKRSGAPRSRQLCRFNKLDQLVHYFKPEDKPSWLTMEAYANLPSQLVLRELRYTISQKGFRPKTITLITTLLCPDAYPAADIEELYQQRWRVETNIHSLKRTMGLDVLRCKTVDGVMKELWMHVLVYNQVVKLIIVAAKRQGVPPDRISFIDMLDVLRESPGMLATLEIFVNPERAGREYERCIKRRKDRHKRMTQSRESWRQGRAEASLVA